MADIDEYEFKRSENLIIDRFARGMLLFSISLMVAGVLTLLQAALSGFALTIMISGLTWTVMGIAFYFPTDNFRKIVETEGNDISELMTAFRELKTGWIFVIIVLLINRLAGLLDLFGVIGG